MSQCFLPFGVSTLPLGFGRWAFGMVLSAFDFWRCAFGCWVFALGLALGFWHWAFGVGLLALDFSRLMFPRLELLVLSFVVGVFALGFCLALGFHVLGISYFIAQ